MSPSSPRPDWLRVLIPRLAVHWRLKAVAIPVFVTAFFVGYFYLLHRPAFDVTVMPFTLPDRVIGFWPGALLPYVSLWLYVFFVPVLLSGWRELIGYVGGAAFVGAVGLGIFFFWPSAVPHPAIAWAEYPGWELLKRVDAAGNACPSLHVAFAVLTAVWLERLLRVVGAPAAVRVLNLAWVVVIALSTLATKQHVALDVLAGTALGLAGALSCWRPAAAARARGPSALNGLTLALAVSVATKLTIWALGIAQSHPGWAAVLFVVPDLWIVGGLLLPNATTLMPVVTHFSTPRREVWLTIDDGPEPATSAAMLDLLDRHRARATFFLIGEKVRAHPALVAELLRRGHTVGNHTHTHPLANFWLAGPARTAREIDACEAALAGAGAAATPWFRAPAGIKTLWLRASLGRRKKLLVGWSARGRESVSTSPEQPLRRLKKRLAPGAILLVHESHREAADRIALLSQLLEHLSATGYACVLPRIEDLR